MRKLALRKLTNRHSRGRGKGKAEVVMRTSMRPQMNVLQVPPRLETNETKANSRTLVLNQSGQVPELRVASPKARNNLLKKARQMERPRRRNGKSIFSHLPHRWMVPRPPWR